MADPIVDHIQSGLELEEQFRGQVYDDHDGKPLVPGKTVVGKATVGYGRNLIDRGISREEAEVLLANDVAAARMAVDAHLPWVDRLDQVRYAVLVDMAFNMGMAGLLEFKHTLAAFEAHDWPAAAAGMKSSLWAAQVGVRAQRLIRMVETGKWL